MSKPPDDFVDILVVVAVAIALGIILYFGLYAFIWCWFVWLLVDVLRVYAGKKP